MGGVVGALACLYCRSGCRSSVVASALAFFPPSPPFYELRRGRTGALEWVVEGEPYLVDNPRLEVHFLDTRSKDRVVCFLLRHPQARYTIIISHGNATDCGAMRDHYVLLARTLRCNVCAYDYSGYGRPTEQATYENIEAVYRFVQAHGVVTDPSAQVILYGQSVGSGPSCWLASRAPTRALILHSPIMSGLRVLTSNRCLGCCDIFPNVTRIRSVQCPVYIMHGRNDDEVGLHHGQTMYQAVPPRFRAEPWWVPDAGHNDIVILHRRAYFERLSAFVASLDAGSAVASAPPPTAGGPPREVAMRRLVDDSSDEAAEM